MPERLLGHVRDHRISRWLGGREPVVLLSVLLILVVLWGFIQLADEVLEGDTHDFDIWLVERLRTPDDLSVPVGPRWVQEAGRDATALGGFLWLMFSTFATAGYLWLDRKRHLSMFLLGSAVSGYIVSTLLKAYFQRPRPDLVPHLSYVYNTTSFPSGHSMNAAVIYLTLGAMVAMSVSRKRLKLYVLGVACFITAIVGASRVYLGVHYPTDVLAGWMAGLIWALLCWLVARWLQRRGDVEPSGPVEPTPEETAEPA